MWNLGSRGVTSISQYSRDRSVSMLLSVTLWFQMIGFLDIFFFCGHNKAEQREVGTTVGPCVPIILLYSVHLYYSGHRVTVTDAAGGKAELSDRVCVIGDAPTNFKSDVRKNFGLPAL